MSDSRVVERILRAVDQIPVGRVMTYGSVAELVGGVTPRSVGRTLKNKGHDTAWWRVVTAAGHPPEQARRAVRALFDLEGTPLIVGRNGTYTVDMSLALWEPASAAANH